MYLNRLTHVVTLSLQVTYLLDIYMSAKCGSIVNAWQDVQKDIDTRCGLRATVIQGQVKLW